MSVNKFVGVPLPTEEGLWWWLSNDEAPEPIVVEVVRLDVNQRIALSGTLHAGMGQHGWNWDQPVDSMGGQWMRVDMPVGRWNEDISLNPERTPVEVLARWLLPSTIEKMKVETEEGDVTGEILFITAMLEELADSAADHANDLLADERILSAEDTEARAERYRQSRDAIMEIWGCSTRSSPQDVEDQLLKPGMKEFEHHLATRAKYRMRGWLFSWQAFRLGLGWWNWKPVVKARWETPTSGHAGNQLRQPEVTLSLEWLSAFVEFTITPVNQCQ